MATVIQVQFKHIDRSLTEIKDHLKGQNSSIKENREAIIKINERVSLHSKIIKGTIGFFIAVFTIVMAKLFGKG